MMLSRYYHGLVPYGSCHMMLSPAGCIRYSCHVLFTNTLYFMYSAIHIYSCAILYSHDHVNKHDKNFLYKVT
ncbi:hypothetical protein M6B38_268055 [Iris pallida]|uniref:Uncharacterized protein n=1 Tax=Iris pallida TaxID=29817 RepID=A0AAX6DMG9_IRIPA|nr:hypothetical protein M6B38_238925 [Iris pallida]KAJ6849651.1 hypothetical protein M6B38_268055 [Iris pallida]